jgi:release factor glutamine methyltransferase
MLFKNSLMLLKSYKSTFLQELSTLYDEKEIESFFYIVLESFHNKKRIDLALNPEMEMDAVQLLRWESVLSDLKKEKPIQYILGETEFYGLPFLVNENTLIPRPETEELVEWIISNNEGLRQAQSDKSAKLKILDIGTGSGCISISLAKNLPDAQVTAIDVSEKALATAYKNAEINKVEVNFILENILETEVLDEKYDIIVSNPPYVRNLEKEEIKPNVLEYEPHLALFVEDNDALLFYRKIAELAKKNLSENGKLYFEINQYLGKETVRLLEGMDFKNVILKKDVYGNDRMISCWI